MSQGSGATALISCTLQRGDNATTWGFRLRGGAEYNSLITIERVIFGSLADRCGLRPGDILRAISGQPSSHMRHEDAHDAVLRAGNLLKLELERQIFDESRCSTCDDDRATPSSASWSRASGAGSKARSPYLPADLPPSSLPAPYDARSRLEVDSRPRADYVNGGRKAGRPKEIDAVVGELKQHRDNGDDQSDKPIRPSVWCPPRRQSTQSKSFLILQSLLESGEEDPKIPRPAPQWYAPVTADYWMASGEAEAVLAAIPEKADEEEADKEGSRPHSRSSDRLAQQVSPSTPTPRSGYPPADAGVPVVPVPRRSPGPRPTSLGSPGPRPTSLGSPPSHQPRAFRPGAAIRQAAVNSASRIPVCNRCSRNIRGPFIIALDKTWCPEHFLCDKCGCDMVEIGFVETPDGKVYCEDDYGRYMAPRCHRCRQAIIGTIVKALSAEWHTDCFTCAHCNKTLAGAMFHVEDGKPYCEKDYAAMFQTQCKGCEFPIEPGDRWVEAAGDNYHVTCFACTTCQCSLSNRGFVMRNGKPYCSTHARGL